MKKALGFILLTIFLFIFSGCTIENLRDKTDQYFNRESKLEEKLPELKINQDTNETDKQTKALTSFTEVADYIHKYGKLPDNFITKAKARKLGWNSSKGNLDIVAPGKSIGGDIFTNSEGVLPDAPGRKWHEADIGYKSGFRGSKRILYSNDGLIYKTTDHYKTFTRLY